MTREYRSHFKERALTNGEEQERRQCGSRVWEPGIPPGSHEESWSEPGDLQELWQETARHTEETASRPHASARLSSGQFGRINKIK